MRMLYRVLAYLISALVVVQAGAIAFAFFGLGAWIDGGGVLDKAAMESEEGPDFVGVVGFMIHGMNGTMLIPLVGLLLLIVSPFAKVPRGVLWAAAVLVLIVIQVTLGMMAHEMPVLGMFHGINALLLFSTAFMAGHRARVPSAAVLEAESVPSLS